MRGCRALPEDNRSPKRAGGADKTAGRSRLTCTSFSGRALVDTMYTMRVCAHARAHSADFFFCAAGFVCLRMIGPSVIVISRMESHPSALSVCQVLPTAFQQDDRGNTSVVRLPEMKPYSVEDCRVKTDRTVKRFLFDESSEVFLAFFFNNLVN